MAEPPVLAAAVKATETDPFPAVAVPIKGAAGGVAYVRGEAFVSHPLLVVVSLTGPTAVGVIVKVCVLGELLKFSRIGLDSPPPEVLIVTVPL